MEICIPAHGRSSSSCLFLRYNQQISRSQIHKQSFVLLCCLVFFWLPGKLAIREIKKKLQAKIIQKKGRGGIQSRVFLLAGVTTLLTAQPQTAGCCWWCSRGNAQVHTVTWADDSSAITHVSMATFPKRGFGETMISVIKPPHSNIHKGRNLSLFLSSAVSSSSSSRSVAAVNGTIVGSVSAPRRTSWWRFLCEVTKRPTQCLLAATWKEN